MITNGLEVYCFVLLFLKVFKQHFNISYVTKVNAQTFSKGHSRCIHLGKKLVKIPWFFFKENILQHSLRTWS